jgi:uncharacterized protein (DUF2147 family)
MKKDLAVANKLAAADALALAKRRAEVKKDKAKDGTYHVTVPTELLEGTLKVNLKYRFYKEEGAERFLNTKKYKPKG